MPPVTALRPNAVARVEVVHGVQLVTETAERYDNVHKVREILLDSFSALSAFVAGHEFTEDLRGVGALLSLYENLAGPFPHRLAERYSSDREPKDVRRPSA